jgi:hypothetical protein
MLPEIVEPDLLIELAAITVMVLGTEFGGGALLPGSVFHVPGQEAGLGVVKRAKPLKVFGAAPPLRVLAFDHWAPQNVTFFPTTAFRSPITKLP